MSQNPKQPKKPQRNKYSKKITLNTVKRWKDIVEDVDKREVPINILTSQLMLRNY